MLDEIKEKLDNILANVDEENREKYTLIKDIISNPEWYNQIDVDTCISILVDLGYTVDEARNVYMQLKGIEV